MPWHVVMEQVDQVQTSMVSNAVERSRSAWQVSREPVDRGGVTHYDPNSRHAIVWDNFLHQPKELKEVGPNVHVALGSPLIGLT